MANFNSFAISPQARETKAKFLKGDYIKQKKSFPQQRKQSTKEKDCLLNGRKYLQTIYLTRS